MRELVRTGITWEGQGQVKNDEALVWFGFFEKIFVLSVFLGKGKTECQRAMWLCTGFDLVMGYVA